MDTSVHETAIEGFRLSPIQQQLWRAQLQQASGPLMARATYRISGQYNAERLRDAWDALVERHEILRTSFAALDGMDMPLQVIAPAVPNPLALADGAADGAASGAWLEPLQAGGARLHLQVPALCADVPSLTVLATDLVRLYDHTIVPDADVPQYVDLSEWQHDLLEADEATGGRTYWQDVTANLPPLPVFPWEAPANASGTGDVSFRLPAARADEIAQLASTLGCATETVLLTCWYVLLARTTGTERVAVGVWCDGRAHDELAGAVGPLSRQVPLIASVGQQSFAACARDLSAGLQQATRWQECFVVPAHMPAGWPLAFSYTRLPAPDLTAGMQVLVQRANVDAAPAGLELRCIQTESGIDLHIGYDPRRIAPAAAERLAGQYVELVQACIATPYHRVSILPLLDAAQRQTLQRLALGEQIAPATGFLHQQVEHYAASHPTALAVVAEDGALTYDELNRRANRLARQLRAAGVGPESPVVIWQERTTAVVTSMLAVLKAGGYYVPLDPSLPRERVALLLADTGATVVLAGALLRDKLPATSARVIVVDAAEQHDTEADANLALSCDAAQLAYLIYTSGSTGTPKGVMVAQHQVAHYTTGLLKRLGLPAGASYATVSTFGADLGNTAVFAALWSGGTLHIIGHELARTPDAFAAYMRQHQIDCLKIVPSHLGALLVASHPEDVLPRTCLVLGGEAARPEMVASIHALVPDCRILNHYGPTETTVGALTFSIPADRRWPAGATALPLGRPLPAGSVYVLDALGAPVPIGTIGELYLGGPGVARGYLGRPDATAERFVPDPAGSVPGARLYRTGDRGRMLPDGSVEFVGRADDQVKIRGYRVELGEIAGTLSQHPDIASAIALVRNDPGSEPRVVAYIVFGGSRKPGLGELRRFAQARLPEYMIPAAFVVLEQLPLTENGKIDRRALPAPEQRASARAAEQVAPRNASEALLAKIWSEVLNKPVGIHDNFFALGGDSILSIQIIAYANQQGLRLTPKHLFEHPTVAQLAAVAEIRPQVTTDQHAIEGAVPLTPIQHWFFGQQQPRPDHYNQSVLIDLYTPVSQQVAEQVINQLLQHHDALRLRFDNDAGTWAQQNAPADVSRVSMFNLAHLPAPAQDAAREQAATDLHQSLRIGNGPLLKAALVHYGPARPDQLLLVIHHLAVDGVSWRILVEDIQTCIQQIGDGQPLRLPAKTTSFKAWAEQLAAYAARPERQHDLAFWQQDGTVPALPCDHPDQPPACTVAYADTVAMVLPAAESQLLLDTIPASLAVQPNDVLLAALALAIFRWSGQQAVLVDMEGHGRDTPLPDVDLSRTVGWFTARYPLALRLPEDTAPVAVVRQVKEQLRQIPHGGMGYGVLRYLGAPEIRQQLQARAAPQISFNYLGQISSFRSPVLGWSQDSSGAARSPQTIRQHRLELNSFAAEGSLHLGWVFCTTCYRRETIEQLAAHYTTALRDIIAQATDDDVHGFTPSDFPQARLNQSQLDAFLAQLGADDDED